MVAVNKAVSVDMISELGTARLTLFSDGRVDYDGGGLSAAHLEFALTSTYLHLLTVLLGEDGSLEAQARLVLARAVHLMAAADVDMERALKASESRIALPH